MNVAEERREFSARESRAAAAERQRRDPRDPRGTSPYEGALLRAESSLPGVARTQVTRASA